MAEKDIVSGAVNADELADMPFAARGADMLERTGLSGRVFYDVSSKQFYVQNAEGEWCGRDQRTFATYLKFLGYCPLVRSDKQEKISEVDHVMAHISLNCAVGYAGPIAGYRKGLISNNGQRVLVTREAQIMRPEKGDWATLEELFTQLFGHGSPDRANDGPDQLPYFYGWWKHALECLESKYDDKRCLCMTFAGEAGCGKTLVKDLISMSMGGRECKPYRFMIGQENFNGEFIGSELWVVDDEQASSRYKDRSEFGANIKKTVADKYYRIRGMMRDGVIVEMFKLLLICVNREPERLMVLPPLEDDVADKISILMAHKHDMPMPVGSPDEKREFWATLTSELPHFIHWLLYEYKIDESLFGRFGVTHFHHPDLCADLFYMSPARVLWEQIERVLKFDDLIWYQALGATELRNMMTDEESSPLSRNEMNSLPYPTHMGSQLHKIATMHPERLVQRKVGGVVKWVIVKAGLSIDAAVDSARRASRAGTGQAEGDFEDI